MPIAGIAFKNLSRQKRRTFLLAGAIAFGVMVVSLVNGLVGGILKSSQDNYALLYSGHIFAMNFEFPDKKKMLMRIADDAPYAKAADELAARYPVLYRQKRTSIFDTTLIFQNNTVWRQVDGVDFSSDRFVGDQIELVAGSMKSMGRDDIVLGEKTAKSLDVRVGESILIQTETINGQANVVEAPVRAIYKEGQMSSGICYMNREAVNSLLDMAPGSFNWYVLMMKRFSDIDAASKDFAALLKAEGQNVVPREKVANKDVNTLMSDIRKDKDKTARVAVSNLNDQMASLKGVFDTIRLVSLCVLGILLLVIMVGLNNTYKIIVWERKKEIGTMRALGMQRSAVTRIFLLEAVFLALGGAAAGLAVSTCLLSLIGLFAFGNPADFAIFLHKGRLVWEYDLGLLALSIGLVAGLTLIAALSPASKAGRVDPAVALRAVA